MPANMQRRHGQGRVDGYKLNYCAYAMLHAVVYTHLTHTHAEQQQTTNNLWPTDRKQQLHLHSLPLVPIPVASVSASAPQLQPQPPTPPSVSRFPPHLPFPTEP